MSVADERLPLKCMPLPTSSLSGRHKTFTSLKCHLSSRAYVAYDRLTGGMLVICCRILFSSFADDMFC